MIIGDLLSLGFVEVTEVVQQKARTRRAAFDTADDAELHNVGIAASDVHPETKIAGPPVELPVRGPRNHDKAIPWQHLLHTFHSNGDLLIIDREFACERFKPLDTDTETAIATKFSNILPVDLEHAKVIAVEPELFVEQADEFSFQPLIRCQLNPVVFIEWGFEIGGTAVRLRNCLTAEETQEQAGRQTLDQHSGASAHEGPIHASLE